MVIAVIDGMHRVAAFRMYEEFLKDKYAAEGRADEFKEFMMPFHIHLGNSFVPAELLYEANEANSVSSHHRPLTDMDILYLTYKVRDNFSSLGENCDAASAVPSMRATTAAVWASLSHDRYASSLLHQLTPLPASGRLVKW